MEDISGQKNLRKNVKSIDGSAVEMKDGEVKFFKKKEVKKDDPRKLEK